MKTINYFMMILAILFMIACESDTITEDGALVPLTVEDDTSLPFIEVNNTLLHSEIYGDTNDPMILMIHGGPGSDYRSILNASNLANDGFFVVFYDQRGSGLSKRHDADIYTVDLYIDDLSAVINYYRQADQKLILMGHSWGAMLASAYVNKYPGEADALILMEPGGLNWDDTQEYINRALALNPFEENSNDFVYLDQFITSDEHEILDYKAANQTIAAGGDAIGDPSHPSFWRQGAVCNKASIDYTTKHSFDFTENLDQYTNEVLFIYSEKNTAYGKDHATLVSSAFTNLNLIELKGCGHEMVEFGWNNLYPIIKEYLTEIL